MNNWITCPATDRAFPSIKQFELRTCIKCKGLIDIRHDAWYDLNPGAYHSSCPVS